jgi:hypothetical protein
MNEKSFYLCSPLKQDLGILRKVKLKSENSSNNID